MSSAEGILRYFLKQKRFRLSRRNGNNLICVHCLRQLQRHKVKFFRCMVYEQCDVRDMIRSMTRPAKWPVHPAKTQSDQSLCVRVKKTRVLSYPLSAQRRLWSALYTPLPTPRQNPTQNPADIGLCICRHIGATSKARQLPGTAGTMLRLKLGFMLHSIPAIPGPVGCLLY